MAQQPLFPPNPKDDPRQRAEALVRVIVRLYLGLLVAALPGLGIWAENNLWTYSPVLVTLAGNGFVRGLVSGLGLLNLWLAVIDARTARELF